MMKVENGTQVMLAVAPGWLLAGTVESATDTEIVLAPATWLETPSGEASMTDLASVKDPSKVVSVAHHMPRICVMVQALLWWAVTATDVARAMSPEAAALRKVR